jgi:cytochrome P450
MSRSPLAGRSFFRDPVRYLRAETAHEPTIKVGAAPRPFVLVRDPELIWRVLVTDGALFRQGKWKRRARRFVGDTLNTLEGDAHRRRRRMLQPSLARSRIAAFSPSIIARAEGLQAGWEDGARLRIRDAIDPLSLAVAGEVLLSTELAPVAAELTRELSTVMSTVPRLTPPLVGTRQGRALARVERAVGAIVSERLSAGGGPDDDLLAALLASGLPEETVRGELIAFLLAAVDEPPSALEAAWYLLGRNAGAEERFHAELDEVLGEASPSAVNEASLPYLDAVVRETLRLFPPARHIDRCPVADVRIGDSSFSRAHNVILSPLVTHRDPELYKHPSAFAPERWLAPDRRPPQGAYLPFGAGAHACIGQPLARAIVILVLATIGRGWRMRVDADAPSPTPRGKRLEVRLERR